MGHARAYVSFDIIKRIMTDYFGYNVKVSLLTTMPAFANLILILIAFLFIALHEHH